MSERIGEIGGYWLTRHVSNSNQWKRTWYDAAAKLTRRARLGAGDFSDLETAKIALAKWVIANQQLRHEAADSIPLDLVLVRYWEGHAKAIRSAKAREIELRYWSEHFAGKTVADLTPAALGDFVAALERRGLAKGTISRILDAGRSALNRARKRQEVKDVPFIPDVMTAADKRDRAALGRPLTIPEMAALLEHVHEPHMAMFLMIVGNTLARPEAAVELGLFQIDADQGRVDLSPPGRRQTKKYRPIVPLTRTLAEWTARPAASAKPAAVKRRKRERVVTDRLVTYGGRPVKSVGKAFRALRTAAGLDDAVTPYSLRHTLPRELRRRRVPAEQIKMMLGHLPRGSDATTAIYAPYDPDYCLDAAAAIDAYWDEVKTHLFAGILAQMALERPAEAPSNVLPLRPVAG